MPLKKDVNKEHELYCSHCYVNNEFVNPNLTLDEMKELNFKIMTEEMKFPKWMANAFNKKLSKLERWKQKGTN